MNHFTINDIENLTGIKAHTLRIWEQRYGVCPAKRKESGHRFYDDEDLKHILRLALLYKYGHKISHLAAMTETELKQLAHSIENCCQHEGHVLQLLEATQAFDQQRFNHILDALILRLGFEKAVLEVMFPYLEKIGMYWLIDRAIPAQEHFGSNLILRKIVLAIESLPRPVYHTGRRALLFTPAGEPHEIPLLFMAWLLRKNGTPVLYLGKEASWEALNDVLAVHGITHIYTHLITQLCENNPMDALAALKTNFPHVSIVISGKQKAWPVPAKGINWLETDNALLAFASDHEGQPRLA
ncbi:MerR family transcriptional regulator [Flavihumibacter petaseus]|uniref:Putative MerR family transcriptional regulator n=1 Tax=Flavihumibacter petaseus NBRC 106054 TaxID=1220578 RepID=A0A0E9N1P5_9BACT|nr:MerR family transcriptional regulator [Flavihumibacter petaseus]GAO43937.1 putative MerR family transcriptional regulator [Flavihumibacter petaseus NBRC 106054]